MRKRMLALLLAFVMAVGLLPAAAFAQEAAPAHDHTGRTAVTMGTNQIKLGGEQKTSNTLRDGSYYLDADLTVSLTIDGAVDLCLNGHSVTVSSGSAVTVNSGASLTLWDCAADSTGKIAYTGTDASYYGINNQGTLTLNSGAVEGRYCGVNNYSAFTMTGGTVKATGSSGRGVRNNYNSVFRLSGGDLSGRKYGIYNDDSSCKVYLSGSPTVAGTTAGIYTDTSSSCIYADDGADTPTPYSGQAISLGYSSRSNGNTAVYHVTEDTKGKFTLAVSAGSNYELALSEDSLQIQGKPQALTWYGINDGVLTGDGYPDSIPYDTYWHSTDLPAAPAVKGKLFLGWLYKENDDSDWSTRYWSNGYIESATAFKADYLNGGFAGSGTAKDPYRLATAADLQKLAAVVDSGSTVCNNRDIWYKLTADIDLSTVCGEGIGSWKPIGCGDYPFTANFDGNGKTISNLYINTSSSGQGLFGWLSGATVKNLTLTGSVTAGGDLDALARQITDSTVENADVTGVTVTPYGYTTDENRAMAYKVDDDGSNTIHIQGNYKNNWIKTTYDNDSYKVATANLSGAAVTASANLINGGRYVQLSCTVTAGETAVTDGKLAVHADVQIGDNDRAAVEVIQNAAGEVIGLKMVDTHSNKSDCLSQDAQFNLYFDGTGGVTPVDTYWFGYYGERTNSNSTYGYIYFAPLEEGTKSSDGKYEQAGGVYTGFSDADSGFAVSWQNIDLKAGESRTYSFILGVGEKADPPQWSDGNAVTLTLAADAEQNDRLVNVSAKVKDAAGLTDTLYYGVDGGGGVLGEVAADGANMKAITGRLDLSGCAEGSHIFSFWVVNSKGAASASVEREITITADGIQGLDSGGEPAHTHAWAATWTNNAAHHWHECTADGCDVTSNSGKDGYGPHVYDNGQDTTCNTCGYVRTVTPPRPSHTHAWAAAWTNNDTHHWHECAAQGCDVTANADKDGYAVHAEDSGTVTKPATNTENGVKTFKCGVCGRVLRTEEIPMRTRSISGTVMKQGSPVEGAQVTLMRGSTPVAGPVTTGPDGTYTFTGAAPGDCNVVAAKDGKTMTILVTVTDADLTGQDLSMPGENVNSVLDVKDTAVSADAAADVTKAVVGGLEAVAEAVKTENNAASSVTVTMTVEARDEAEAAGNEKTEIEQIKTAAPGKTLEYLDIKVEKQIDNNTPEAITDTGNTVIEIVVPFDFSGKAADSVTVYRCHGGSAAPLAPAQGDAKTGGTFRLDADNGRIHIYATKFSTYAIGYTPEGGGDTPVTPPEPTTPPTTPPVYTGGGGSGPAVYPVIAPASVPNGAVKLSRRNAGRGTTVTITVTPDQGYEIGEVTVTDGGGKEIAVTARGDGKYAFTMPGGKVTVNAVFVKITDGYKNCPKNDTCPLWAYTDAGLEAWYHDSVHYCVENGLMNGYGNGLFGPNDSLSRAQFVQVLYNREGRPAVNRLTRFEDVPDGAWYAEAVRWAAAQGIVSGYGSGKFGSNDNITREQLAVMLWRYAGSPSAAKKELPFTDADKASGYALEALRWAVENGIVNGYGNGRLDPQGPATRAQAAQMLMNFLKK